MRALLLALLLIAIDLLVLSADFYLTHDLLASSLQLSDLSFVILTIVGLLIYEKIYILRYDFWQETKQIFKAVGFSYLLTLAYLTLNQHQLLHQQLFVTLFALFALILLPVGKRLGKRLIFALLPFFKQKTLLVGDAKQMAILKEELCKNWYLGMEDSLKDYESVIISSHGMDLDAINADISRYLDEKRSVYIIPYVTSINFANSNILEYSNIRFSTIEVQNRLLNPGNIFIKNSVDLFATLLVFVPFSLLHGFIAVAIKLDSKGKIFFKQPRLGKDDKDFLCYKYRTMYENSDDLLAQYLKNNPQERSYYERYHKYKNDPRITPVGRFLRRSSLDELPQLINVLRGEMSLVGPRPYMLNEAQKLGDKKQFILKVKPGITGLWQVSGRNNLSFAERIDLELWYIKNWSLWSDFVIIIKTIKVVLFKVGAR